MINKQTNKSKYLSIPELLSHVDEPQRSKLLNVFTEYNNIFEKSRGSTNNHQAWEGGYVDHVQEAMNVAFVLYDFLNNIRPLPFSKSDALIVVFVHDLEKPWKYEQTEDGTFEHKNSLKTKKSHHDFRMQKLEALEIELTSEQESAVRYIEGEMDDYTNQKRVMGPLGAFCHMCDIASARLWFEYPLQENDPWEGAERISNKN